MQFDLSTTTKIEHPISADNRFVTRELLTAEERDAAFRLRYNVFVVENGDKIEGLGLTPEKFEEIHASRMYIDFTDSVAKIFGAFNQNGKLVGTVRSQLILSGLSKNDKSLLQQTNANIEMPEVTTISSRFAFERTYRNGNAPIMLIAHVYRVGMKMGILRDFIFVKERYESLYSRLGYEPACEHSVNDPSVGNLKAMTLDVRLDTRFRRIALRYAEL